MKFEKLVKNKLILIWAAGIVATVLTLGIFVALVPKNDTGVNEKLTKISPKAVGIIENILYNRKGKTKSVEKIPVSVYQNMDKSVMAYLITEDGESELWYTDSSLKPVKIDSADKISECFVADDGKYIVYVTQEDSDSSVQDANGTVHIYCVGNKEKEKLASGVVPYSVVASPDCRSVSYMSNYEKFDDNDMYINGLDIEKQKIAKNGCFALAVSDRAKGVIYVDAVEEELYYYDGEESEKIISDIDVKKVFLNRSEDEVLFSRKGKTYLYKAGRDEADKLCSAEIAQILCSSVEWGTPAERLCADTMSKLVLSESDDTNLRLISTLEDDAFELAEDCKAGKCSDDGKSLLYADEDGLHLVKLADEPKDKLIYEAEEIVNIATNGDFSRIYVVNENDQLIYVNPSGKDTKISSDLSSEKVVVSAITGKVYFLEDDELCEADRTKNSKKKIKSDIVDIKQILRGVGYVNDSGKVGLIIK